MAVDELTKLQVEAWKVTIDVQQHFNDIEMRIRALAVTLLTAIFGAAALAVRDGTTLHIGGLHLNFAAAILAIGLITWMLFYLMDELWYHRLLRGSVNHGNVLEGILGDEFRLTGRISEASPFELPRFKKRDGTKRKVSSTWKIRIFYWII